MENLLNHDDLTFFYTVHIISTIVIFALYLILITIHNN